MQDSTSKGIDRAERVRALHDQLVEGVRALSTSEDWLQSLETAARFPLRSLTSRISGLE